MTITIDSVVRILTFLVTAGIFGALMRLVIWAISLEPRIESIETQSKAQGTMLQQMTASVAHIEGRLEDGKWRDVK